MGKRRRKKNKKNSRKNRKREKNEQHSRRKFDATPRSEWTPAATWEPPGAMDDGSTSSRDVRGRNIQRAMAGTDTSQDEVPDKVLDVIGSGGMPLRPSIQRSLEDRMDTDFSNVRIHTGAKAAEAADAIDARAFTCGNSIVFNAGEYDLESAEGQHLLAHELAHVKQQNGGAPLSMMPKPDADLEIDPDPQLEREADQASEEALQDGPVTINRMGTDVHIQRTKNGSDSDSRSGVDQNKLNHIFGNQEHNLSPVVNYFGSEGKAFEEIKKQSSPKPIRGILVVSTKKL